MDGLGAGGPGGRVLHRRKGLEEGRMAEISLALVTLDSVEKGRDLEKFEAGVHEVEVLDVFLGRHTGNWLGMGHFGTPVRWTKKSGLRSARGSRS